MLKTGKNYPTDMWCLAKLLKKNKITFTLREHPSVKEGAKKLLGYNPAGDWQILIDTKFSGLKYSVIRGMCSFGLYEIMAVSTTGEGIFKSKLKGYFFEPERFRTAEDLIKSLLTEIKTGGKK